MKKKRRPSTKTLLNKINQNNKTQAMSDIAKDIDLNKMSQNTRKSEGLDETGRHPKNNNLYFLKDHPLKIIERCNKIIREEEKRDKMRKVSKEYKNKKIEMYEVLEDKKEIKLLEVFNDVVEVIMELGHGEEKDYKIFKILNCCETNKSKDEMQDIDPNESLNSQDGIADVIVEYMIYAGYVWKFGKE